MAQTPELPQMHLANPRGPQLLRQGRSVKLRIVSRSGDTAYVDDMLDAVRSQKPEDVVSCAVRMPNGQDRGHFWRFHINQVPPVRLAHEQITVSSILNLLRVLMQSVDLLA